MSERNGDRARFQKNRKRQLLKRQRLQALLKTLRPVMAVPALEASPEPHPALLDPSAGTEAERS